MRFVVVLSSLVACVGGADLDSPEIEANGTVQLQIPLDGNRPVDILLVIDNSPAMAAHQERLEANLRRLGAILHPVPSELALGGGHPSLRLGVVTTDLGGGDCGGAGEDGRLRGMLVEHAADTGIVLRNFDGLLEDALVALGTVGTSGCVEPQPLAAAKRALEHPANAGFVRADSALAIIFITASDAPDESIEGYEALFKSLHADYRLFVGGVLGVMEGQLASLLARFERSARTALADPDWSPVLGRVTSPQAWTSYGLPCLDALADVDPAMHDVQYACDAWYEFPAGAQHVPACVATSAGPCWTIVENAQWCPTEPNRLLQVKRPLVALPSRSLLRFECVSR